MEKEGLIEFEVSAEDFKASGWHIPRAQLIKKNSIGKGEYGGEEGGGGRVGSTVCNCCVCVCVEGVMPHSWKCQETNVCFVFIVSKFSKRLELVDFCLLLLVVQIEMGVYKKNLSPSLSLSLSHTHTHTVMVYMYIVVYYICINLSLSLYLFQRCGWGSTRGQRWPSRC